MRKLIALSALLVSAACGPAPDYTTKSGVAVYDSDKRSNADEIQAWLDIIAEKAPTDNTRVRTIADIYDGASITIRNEEDLTCSETAASGCANGATGSIDIAWHDCSDAWSSASILAHEVGHILGYHHDKFNQGKPWYFDAFTTAVESLVQQEVCPK